MPARNSTPSMIGGFASVQAVKRSGKGRQEARTRESVSRLPNAEKLKEKATAEEIRPPASRIGHTVMPERHELVCYECGFAFKLTGKLGKTFCSKCRQQLNTDNHTVTGAWSEEIRTMATIEVLPDAVTSAAQFICHDLIVAGDVRQTRLRVCRRLELRDGARIDFATLDCKELLIAETARFAIHHNVKLRQIEIRGHYSGNLDVSESVIIRAGGFYTGSLRTPRLIMEDGAGLSATLHLGPEAMAETKAKAA